MCGRELLMLMGMSVRISVIRNDGLGSGYVWKCVIY